MFVAETTPGGRAAASLCPRLCVRFHALRGLHVLLCALSAGDSSGAGSRGERWRERWYNAPLGPPTSPTQPPGARPQKPQSAGVSTLQGRPLPGAGAPGPLAPVFCGLAHDVWWWWACPGRSRWPGVIFLRSQFEKEKSLILWAID